MIRAGIGPHQDEEGTWNQATKKMSELFFNANNTIASSALRTQQTMTVQYSKDFFGHPQVNTLSDIDITREVFIIVSFFNR